MVQSLLTSPAPPDPCMWALRARPMPTRVLREAHYPCICPWPFHSGLRANLLAAHNGSWWTLQLDDELEDDAKSEQEVPIVKSQAITLPGFQEEMPAFTTVQKFSMPTSVDHLSAYVRNSLDVDAGQVLRMRRQWTCSPDRLCIGNCVSYSNSSLFSHAGIEGPKKGKQPPFDGWCSKCLSAGHLALRSATTVP